MDCLSEIWKPIPNYEGLYEASNLGRIRTAEGKTTSSARFPKRVWKQRVLKPKVQTRSNGRQDKRVSLWKDGVETTQLVARLVALAFLPAPYEKLTVNHINGNPMDNRIENLEWVTAAENIQKGFETGLYSKNEKAICLTSEYGMTVRFKSMSAASRWLGRGNTYVSNAIAHGRPCYETNGKKYWASIVGDGDAPS